MTLTIFVLIVLLFSYFRLTIIHSGNVAYTYDQGRDFLAGARMIVDRDPVFIGPTTGIGGMFHGPWWYYMTAFSFVVLGSNPLNYYYCLFAIHLVALCVWMWAIRKYFGDALAMLSSLIIASAPYYVSSHTFAGNNILTIPSFTFFCLTLVSITFVRDRHASMKLTLFLSFLFGLWAGFVAETELSFGIFITPAIISLFALSKELRDYVMRKYHLLALFIGLSIPFLPRLLFEVKNNFLQTKVLLGFFTKPKLYNPRSYPEVFNERVQMFRGYFEQSVGSNLMFWIFVASLLLLGYVLYSRSRHTSTKASISATYLHLIRYLAIVLGGLFVFCLVYRDPFWGNYYEGIQVGFLLLFVTILAIIKQNLHKAYSVLLIITFACVSMILGDRLYATINFRANMSGLVLQSSVVNHIVDTQKSRNEPIFCARVFTPPVIPHTYDYLWFYHYREQTIETPRYEFQNGRCWYIIEPEWKGFEFRQIEWKKRNIPEKTEVRKGSIFEVNGIQVQELVEAK